MRIWRADAVQAAAMEALTISDFRSVSLLAPATGYGWLVSDAGTRALVPGVPVPMPRGTFKLCAFDVRKNRVCATSAAFLMPSVERAEHASVVSVGCAKFGIVGAVVTDYTGEYFKCAKKHEVTERNRLDQFVEGLVHTHGLQIRDTMDLRIMSATTLESDNPSGLRMPMLSGHRALGEALGGHTPDEVFDEFRSCMAAAKATLRFDPRYVLRGKELNVCAMLFITAMRMYGGVYRDRSESIDDLTMPAVKLYANGDCDDMALAAASFANALAGLAGAERYASTEAYGAFAVLRAVSPRVACVVYGRAVVGTKNVGHAWGYVDTNNVGRLMLEATNTVSALVGPLTALYGASTFAQSEDPGFGVKELDHRRYKSANIVYTDRDASVPSAGGYVGCDLLSLLEMKCGMHTLPRGDLPVLLESAMHLRACPSPAEVQRASIHARARLTNKATKVPLDTLRAMMMCDPCHCEAYVEVSSGNVIGVEESTQSARVAHV